MNKAYLALVALIAAAAILYSLQPQASQNT